MWGCEVIKTLMLRGVSFLTFRARVKMRVRTRTRVRVKVRVRVRVRVKVRVRVRVKVRVRVRVKRARVDAVIQNRVDMASLACIHVCVCVTLQHETIYIKKI